jgi:tetratricopeptide (TPR) repeat protein
MATFKLGRTEQSRQLLTQVEQWYSEKLKSALTAPQVQLPRELAWEDWLRFELERREANLLIAGKPAPVNPWWQLYRGRLFFALGQSEKAEAELKAVVATHPEDAGILLARCHIYEEWGRFAQAKADFDKAVKLKPTDPMPWIEHLKYLDERGRQKEADDGYGKAVAAGTAPKELYRFLEAGWWVAGPFSGPFEVPSMIERQFNPAAQIGGSGWRRIQPDQCGVVQPARAVNTSKDTSHYAVNHVFSPAERTMLLHVGGTDRVRVWLNGNLVHETTKPITFAWGCDRIPVTLRQGRNTLVVKVAAATGSPWFILRLGDDPASQGLAFAEMGLWKEATEAWKPLFADRLPGNWTWLHQALFLKLSGDEAGYAKLRKRVLDEVQINGDAPVNQVCQLCSELPPHADKTLSVHAQSYKKDPTQKWRLPTLAFGYYRKGDYKEALHWIEQVPLNDWRWDKALAAMIYHAAGRQEEARRQLDQFEAWYEKVCHEAMTASEFRSPFLNSFWGVGEAVALRSEAHILIRGEAPKHDPMRDELLPFARKVWDSRDPKTEAYDHALRVQPNEARLWFARAARRLDLGRREEATADFRKAIELAGNEPPIQKDFLRLYAELGNPEQAAAVFARHLDRLPKDERWMSARSAAVFDLIPNKAAFDKLIELRPKDTHLIVCRGRDHFRHGRFTEAKADYLRAIQERPVSEDWLEACEICLLTGDEAGYRRLCHALIAKAGDQPTPFGAFVLARSGGLSLASGVEPARLVAWANQALESGRPAYFEYAAGLANYRAGDMQTAINHLDQSNNGGWSEDAKGQNWLALAMAHAKAGQLEEARRCLKEGRKRLKLAAPPGADKPIPGYCGDWGALQILLAEAETVVEGKQKPEPQ